MDGLTGYQVSAQDFLHHEDVFEDVHASRRSWVAGSPDHDEPSLVASLPALPIAVRYSGDAPASATRRRLLLLRGSALTEVSGPACRATEVPTRQLVKPS